MKKSTRIVFSGDVSFSKYFSDKQDSCFIAPEILSYLRTSDYCVLNIESPLTCQAIESNSALTHVSDPGKAVILQTLGRNVIWSLGNNHIMDCGFAGLEDTIRCAHSVGATVVGAGESMEEALEPLIVGDGVKVGVLVVTKPWSRLLDENGIYHTVPWHMEARIKDSITLLRQRVHHVVIIIHGGDEFAAMPLPYLRNRYRQLLSLGADVIVGHHPHVIENYERVRGGKLIFYSLGNFIFDTDYQRAQKHTDVGILLGLTFFADKIEFDYMSVKNDRTNNCILKSETPAIFCDVQEKDYRKLWPLAAAKYLRANCVAEKVKNPNLLKKPALWFILRDVHGYKNTLQRQRVFGFILSWLGVHWLSEKREVVHYISKQ